MIDSRKQLMDYLEQDAAASYRRSIKAHGLRDDIWKFQRSMRYAEYYANRAKKSPLYKPAAVISRQRFARLSVKLGFSIPYTNIGKGFSIAHYGLLVINGNTVIGENCRIQEGICIGTTNGSDKAPRIGNNVFIGSGAKIIGDIEIADDVAIGAGAVVVKSITEPGTTWAGVPARKVSNTNSHSNLSPLLNLD